MSKQFKRIKYMYEFVNCAIKSPLHSKPSDTSKLMQTSYCIDVLIYTYVLKSKSTQCTGLDSRVHSNYLLESNDLRWDQTKRKVWLESALKS